jgi:hypothetical protein
VSCCERTRGKKMQLILWLIIKLEVGNVYTVNEPSCWYTNRKLEEEIEKWKAVVKL